MEITRVEHQRLTDQAALGAAREDRERFWRDVEKTETCWLWKGALKTGYGSFSFCSRSYSAHRISLLWTVGHPNPGKMACHLCRNRNCVRPEHLYFGTAAQNSSDKRKDGTHLEGERHPMATITSDVAQAIREMVQEKGVSAAKVAHRIGVSRAIVKSIAAGKTWANGDTVSQRTLIGIRKFYGLKGHPQAILNEHQVLEIRRRLFQGEKLKDIAQEFCVSKPMISHIRTRRAWSHLPDEQNGEMRVSRHAKRLSDEEAAQIKKVLRDTGGGYGVGSRLAKEFGTSPTVINYIKMGKTFAGVEPNP